MNSITLCGNLTKDPVLKDTPTGKKVCQFSMAVNRSTEEGVDFFDCIAWEKTGENIARFFSKGKRILIQGKVKIDTYLDKDNNKRKSITVVVGTFDFIEQKSRAQGGSTNVTSSYHPTENLVDLTTEAESDSGKDLAGEMNIDDYPF